MSDELSELERMILPIIEKDSHRAQAITRILQSHKVVCSNNDVVQALNSLEQKQLAERFTNKTWIATSRAQEHIGET